jgi:hypothetical protein
MRDCLTFESDELYAMELISLTYSASSIQSGPSMLPKVPFIMLNASAGGTLMMRVGDPLNVGMPVTPLGHVHPFEPAPP